MLRIVITVCALWAAETFTDQTLEVELCDCTNATQSQVFKYDTNVCTANFTPPEFQEVMYQLVTDLPEVQVIKGVACTSYSRKRVVTTSLFSGTDIIASTLVRDTTPEQCQTMIKTKKCGSNTMDEVNGKWQFEQEPSGSSFIGQSTTYEILNCVVQQVSLLQKCPKCPVHTPLGDANMTTGSISANHVTIIWEKLNSKNVTCTRRILGRGLGFLSVSKTNATRRLEAPEAQLDFHVEPKPTKCVCRASPCTSPAYQVIGRPHLFIETDLLASYPSAGKLPAGSKPSTPRFSAATLQQLNEKRMAAKPKPQVTAEEVADVNQEAHEQYKLDMIIDMINELSQELLYAQCEAMKQKFLQAIIIAQLDGFAAANHLGFPKCAKLLTNGEFVVIQQCSIKKLSLATQTLDCGAAPTFKARAISRDGNELINSPPQCRSRAGFTVIAGIPYRFDGDNWKKVTPVQLPDDTHKAHLFAYAEENSLQTKIINPGHEQNNELANLLDELNVKHQRASVATSESPHPASILENIKVANSWWETVKLYGSIILIIVFALLIAKFCAICGLCSLIKNFICCLCKRREPPLPHQPTQIIQLSDLNTVVPLREENLPL